MLLSICHVCYHVIVNLCNLREKRLLKNCDHFMGRHCQIQRTFLEGLKVMMYIVVLIGIWFIKVISMVWVGRIDLISTSNPKNEMLIIYVYMWVFFYIFSAKQRFIKMLHVSALESSEPELIKISESKGCSTMCLGAVKHAGSSVVGVAGGSTIITCLCVAIKRTVQVYEVLKTRQRYRKVSCYFYLQ